MMMNIFISSDRYKYYNLIYTTIKMAKDLGCSDHILASAKENKNVNNAFTKLAQAFLTKSGAFDI